MRHYPLHRVLSGYRECTQFHRPPPRSSLPPLQDNKLFSENGWEEFSAGEFSVILCVAGWIQVNIFVFKETLFFRNCQPTNHPIRLDTDTLKSAFNGNCCRHTLNECVYNSKSLSRHQIRAESNQSPQNTKALRILELWFSPKLNLTH